ncbi:MAG: cyclase [Oceanicoccus sp.]|jgi:cyclase
MKQLSFASVPLFFTTLLISSMGFSHDGAKKVEALDSDGILKAFNWDLDKTEIKTQTIGKNFHVLFGSGGNIAVSIGSNGVLIVDDQFPKLVPKIEAAIEELGGGKVDFAINTHWHFDHADGNLALGPAGTWLVSQANSRQMMLDDHVINLVSVAYDQKAYPKEALPVITFDNKMQFHFNDEQIDLLHVGPAHTTGDTAILFRGNNAVHLGDVFNNAGYPFIDAGNGGTLNGLVEFCSKVLAEIKEDTVVIPGHGPVTDYAGLKNYIEMLSTIRDRMMVLIEQGASLEDVYAAKVTADWDKEMGDNVGFINRSYMSLTHRVVDR